MKAGSGLLALKRHQTRGQTSAVREQTVLQ